MSTYSRMIDVVSTLVAALRDTATIGSIVDNLDGTYTINTTDTGDVEALDEITISGNTYIVNSLVVNTSFNITSSVAVVGTTWRAAAPYFYYGTPKAVNQELHANKKRINKFPAVVLFNITRTQVIDNPVKAIARIPDLKLFFLDHANSKEWLTEDHYSNVISKMETLVELFFDTCKTSPLVGKIEDHSEEEYADFGRYVEQGAEKRVIDDMLSGIGVFVGLPIKREALCE